MAGAGEEGAAEEAPEDEGVSAAQTDVMPTMGEHYQVMGTLMADFHKPTEDISFVLKENEDSYFDEILKCGIIIFDITEDEAEIPKASEILEVIEQHLLSVDAVGPKTFAALPEMRVFVLVSNVMTWALTKPIDPVSFS